MTTWRESVSQLVQDDLDGILSKALKMAEEFLHAFREIPPFGGLVSVQGEVSLTMIKPSRELGEYPAQDDVLARLYRQVCADRDGLRATAFVADVRDDASRAVRLEFDTPRRGGTHPAGPVHPQPILEDRDVRRDECFRR